MTTTLPPAPYTGVIRCTFVQCESFYTVRYRVRPEWQQVLDDNCASPWVCVRHKREAA